jgi:uncharacterized protein YbaR (Trm112 family)
MMFSPDVLAVLVDPRDHQSLQYIESENCFYNERTKTRYRITEEGIGVLLVDSGLADGAESVSDDEHRHLQQLIAEGQSIATGTRG